jgi:two-component system CheB/CheR fusion protein
VPPPEIAPGDARSPATLCVAAKQVTVSDPSRDPQFSQILQMLHRGIGVDFSDYKYNTLHRRIMRRMVLHKLESFKDYADMLQRNAGEVEALYHDILINVTSFFRNPEAFAALQTKVFAKLLGDRSRHEPVRIWVLGCSTG